MTTLSHLHDTETPARLFIIAVIAIGAGALGFAYYTQYVWGLVPCPLCLYQRWPHMAAIGLSVIALGIVLTQPTGAARRMASGLMALAALSMIAGAGIAGYHVGVEQGWWASPATCGADFTATDLSSLREQMMATPAVRCSDVAWSLFGLSMAGYNGFLSLAMAGAAGVAAFGLVRAR